MLDTLTLGISVNMWKGGVIINFISMEKSNFSNNFTLYDGLLDVFVMSVYYSHLVTDYFHVRSLFLL